MLLLELRRNQTLHDFFATQDQPIIDLLNAYPHFWVRFGGLRVDMLVLWVVRAQDSFVCIQSSGSAIPVFVEHTPDLRSLDVTFLDHAHSPRSR